MSKAILITEMPNNCNKCRYVDTYMEHDAYCMLTGEDVYKHVIGIKNYRHDSCPLIELPNPRGCNDVALLSDRDVACFRKGWNACLNAINNN